MPIPSVRASASLAFLVCMSFAAAQAGPSFYVSDEAGMAFEEIAEFRKGDFDYVLEVTRGRLSERRSLRDRSGTETKRWKFDLSESGRVGRSEYEEYGLLARIERFDETGRLLAEDRYSEGKAYERVEYRYEGGRLVKALTIGPMEKVIATDVYRYAMNGSLRELTRTYADGSLASAGADQAGGRIVRTWERAGERTSVRFYGKDGALTGIESWGGDAPLMIEDRSRSDGEGRDTVKDLTRGARIERLYDGEGRLVRESSFLGEALSSLTEYAYGDNGKLESKALYSGGDEEKVTYRYGAGGELEDETHRVNGIVMKIVRVAGKDSTWTELYHEGELAVRYFTEAGRKRTEEIIQGGEVVRRREFP